MTVPTMADYGPLIDLLRRRLGLDPESIGLTSLRHAIDEASRAANATGPEALLSQVLGNPDCWLQLVDRIVIPETWWLRIPEQFDDALRWLRLMPEDHRPLRLLSLPCATGEEPYSLAAFLLDGGFPAGSFSVTGIDVSPRAIAFAERAWYPRALVRGCASRPHWFGEDNDGLMPQARVRAHVRFRVGNALDPEPFAQGQQYDLIFCRNLLIYLDTTARERLLHTLSRVLADGGMLCTGQAESLAPWAGLFRPAPGFGPLSHVHRRADVAEAPQPAAVSATAAHPRSMNPPQVFTVSAATTRPAAARTTVLHANQTRAQESPTAPPSLADIQGLADRGGLQAARQACLNRLAVEAECAQTWLLLGLIELACEELDRAAEAFARASYLQPDNLDATRHQAALAERRGEPGEAQRLRARLARMAGAGT